MHVIRGGGYMHVLRPDPPLAKDVGACKSGFGFEFSVRSIEGDTVGFRFSVKSMGRFRWLRFSVHLIGSAAMNCLYGPGRAFA
jgi:hypothetical protein